MKCQKHVSFFKKLCVIMLLWKKIKAILFSSCLFLS
nr:MAG TPA: hypothetical protein [Caudoviricetes sp.]